MTQHIRCNLLPWDSEFFQIRIARLAGTRLSEIEWPEIEDWCRAQRVSCLYFEADPKCAETLRAAFLCRFCFVDMRLVFEKVLAKGEGDSAKLPNIRQAIEHDMSALEGMARVLHTDTRFFKDSRFERARAADLYAEWLRNSWRNSDGRIFTAISPAGAPTGYVACEFDETKHEGLIGLIGVSESARGRGLGAALMEQALNWFGARGASVARVATQAANLPAARLYTSLGFRPVNASVWFHRWFD